jgi:hypothetical protein
MSEGKTFVDERQGGIQAAMTWTLVEVDFLPESPGSYPPDTHIIAEDIAIYYLNGR